MRKQRTVLFSASYPSCSSADRCWSPRSALAKCFPILWTQFIVKEGCNWGPFRFGTKYPNQRQLFVQECISHMASPYPLDINCEFSQTHTHMHHLHESVLSIKLSIYCSAILGLCIGLLSLFFERNNFGSFNKGSFPSTHLLPGNVLKVLPLYSPKHIKRLKSYSPRSERLRQLFSENVSKRGYCFFCLN